MSVPLGNSGVTLQLLSLYLKLRARSGLDQSDSDPPWKQPIGGVLTNALGNEPTKHFVTTRKYTFPAVAGWSR